MASCQCDVAPWYRRACTRIGIGVRKGHTTPPHRCPPTTAIRGCPQSRQPPVMRLATKVRTNSMATALSSSPDMPRQTLERARKGAPTSLSTSMRSTWICSEPDVKFLTKLKLRRLQRKSSRALRNTLDHVCCRFRAHPSKKAPGQLISYSQKVDSARRHSFLLAKGEDTCASFILKSDQEGNTTILINIMSTHIPRTIDIHLLLCIIFQRLPADSM